MNPATSVILETLLPSEDSTPRAAYPIDNGRILPAPDFSGEWKANGHASFPVPTAGPIQLVAFRLGLPNPMNLETLAKHGVQLSFSDLEESDTERASRFGLSERPDLFENGATPDVESWERARSAAGYVVNSPALYRSFASDKPVMVHCTKGGLNS